MRKILTALILALFMTVPASAAEMTISAAASLTNAFNELADMFRRDHPGSQVYTNYAASNPLLRQLVEGAPVDVFASADEATMDQAVEAKVVDPSTRVTFAINDLVVIVPRGNVRPQNLKDLMKFGKIAIGNPASVPAGRYTKNALEAAGLWKDLEKRFILGTNVRQVLEYVASGDVDAGFVYGTDAKQMADRVDVALTIPTDPPVSYPIAVATTGHNPQAGAEFVKFVLSEPAGKVLEKYGFVLPKK